MKIRQFTSVFYAVILLVSVADSYAKEPSAELQVKLQSAMHKYIDSLLVDGGFTYLDTKKNVITTVYPANVHPFVVAVDGEYFVCSEFINENGDTITADYLVREVGGDFKVVQIIVDDRESLKEAMSNAKN